jgi:hypothetical protein
MTDKVRHRDPLSCLFLSHSCVWVQGQMGLTGLDRTLFFSFSPGFCLSWFLRHYGNAALFFLSGSLVYSTATCVCGGFVVVFVFSCTGENFPVRILASPAPLRVLFPMGGSGSNIRQHLPVVIFSAGFVLCLSILRFPAENAHFCVFPHVSQQPELRDCSAGSQCRIKGTRTSHRCSRCRKYFHVQCAGALEDPFECMVRVCLLDVMSFPVVTYICFVSEMHCLLSQGISCQEIIC